MNKKLSIIVPVYNEVNTVLIVLEKLKNLKLYNDYKPQIIIVDDNSNDGTKELLQKLQNDEQYKDDTFLFKDNNMGKGDSQKLAIPLCLGDFTIIQDADLEYNVENINSLLKLLLEKNHDAVLGYRKLKNTKLYSPYFIFHKIAVISLTIITNLLYGSKFKDVCTCYRLIKTPIIKSLKINGERFEYDFSMINQLAKKTKNIGAIEIDYTNRSFQEGKKNTWIVGLYALKRIVLDRFNY
jgi:glycosyltransferase involved in cell wall biosynthesis